MIFISFLGLLAMLLIAWLISNNRTKIPFHVIISGILLQFCFAIIILKTSFGLSVFKIIQDAVLHLVTFSDEGAKFIFGDDFKQHFFAFKVLPTIMFVSCLSYILFYLGVIQKIVLALAWLMHKTMKVSGSESLVTAANIFVGQTEAPLFIKPYLKTMTKSEINAMMTGGMATVAGGVLVAFSEMGIDIGHLLAASVMSAPAALVIAKIIYPEEEKSPTFAKVSIDIKPTEVNLFEAAVNGTSEGLKLALNVGAMLLTFIALVALINYFFAAFFGLFGLNITLEMILGYLFSPIAFVMGIPWNESLVVGSLIGKKVLLNEFVAYIDLGQLIQDGALSPRSITISTYALCGFANFSSIAIQIGGIGNLEPSRRADFAKQGFRAMIGGCLAAFMTACIAGILI